MDNLISRHALCEYAQNQKDKSVTPNDIMRFPSAQPIAKDTNVPVKDCISRQWLMECVNEGWIKFDTEKDENRFIHLVRDIAPSAQPETHEERTETHTCDLIDRQDAISAFWELNIELRPSCIDAIIDMLKALPSAQPELEKYEYHYDHTDCIWYRPEARNRCPVTCAQYRDGWNDAMNYIFRDGKGYMPYRRDKQYGE